MKEGQHWWAVQDLARYGLTVIRQDCPPWRQPYLRVSPTWTCGPLRVIRLWAIREVHYRSFLRRLRRLDPILNTGTGKSPRL
jgi:hypothetical protein